MSKFDYDLFVIGGGSGGVRAARIAAGHGAKVGICEEFRYGGTCVIRGCVPKKMLVYASHFHEEFSDSQAYGWDISVNGFDWPRLIAAKDKEIDRLNNIYIKLLTNAGVELFHGTGAFENAHTVVVDGRRISAKTILIATGGHPFKPQIPGIELSISSNEAFHLTEFPKRVAVVGSGYIAVEFAGIFNGLGSTVDLVFRADQVLRGFDCDVRHHLAEEFRKKGLGLRSGSNVSCIAKTPTGLQLELTGGEQFEVDCVLYATGRAPNTQGLNLAATGVTSDAQGAIVVDQWSRTSQDNIFAVGDVTNRIALTPVALMEGHCFADTEFGNNPREADHMNVPSAVFSQPEMASVGHTEQSARLELGDVTIYRSTFRTLKHTLTDNSQKSLFKLIVNPANDKVIGAHAVGPDAAELIQGVAIAVKCGATKAQFDSTVGIHPTSAEEIVTMREPVSRSESSL